MYIDAFLERGRTTDTIHVAERINGKLVLKQLDPIYEFYYESEFGTYPTLSGGMAEKHEFKTAREMKLAIEKLDPKKIYESTVNVTFKTLAKHYMGCDSPDLNMVFFDIETDFHEKFGYAPPDDPFNRVTAISLYQRWTDKDFVLCMAPVEMPLYEAQEIVNKINQETNNPNSTVTLYTDEKEMFNEFFRLIDDADILSGWNSEFFDIPYMVNRTKKLFGDPVTARFCLWNKTPIPREVDYFGKTVITYDLVGKVHLDYLSLYKKHAGQVEQSYKLDYIGEKVTKENKVQYEGSLDKLYREDFRTFLLYSKQDSILLKKIDDVLDYINLHNRLAHQECVLLKTTMGSVALIDTAIINLAHKWGKVVFDKKPIIEEDEYDEFDEEFEEFDEFEGEEEPEKVSAKAAGAWVQDPIQGLVDWIGCTDFNSLYPTVLRTLGMSTETILGQIRQTYTEAYLNNEIEKQRLAFRGKVFKPKWTEAWHGLFAAIEFTMVHEKSTEPLIVDLEDGSSFNTTGAELYDIIFGDDSNIVMSSNGTLFDKSKVGVIPEILTMWYTERKQQQKMVLDYKHLSIDGIEVDVSKINLVQNDNRMKRVKIHHDDPIFALRSALNKGDYDTISTIINDNGLIVKDSRIFCHDDDKNYCKVASSFWKQNQQIRKILLNSLYGALLNQSSTFYDRRLGQSVTLTGRTMTKHMASTINEIVTGVYDHTGGAVVYGDSVTGDSVLDVIINGEQQQITIEELYEMNIRNKFIDKVDKEYVPLTDVRVKTFDKETSVVYYDDAKNVMKHKNNKHKFQICTEHNSCNVTSDHSVVAEVNGIISEYKPSEIQEFLNKGVDVYLIVAE